jgi:tRNA A-37 threonylcarbamoyl transferase component Bud32
VSANAQVFQISCGDDVRDVVMKIMPKAATNAHEIKTAIALANLVVTRKSKHFPIVFAHGHCNEVVLTEPYFENRFRINERLKIIKTKYNNRQLKDPNQLLNHDPFGTGKIILFNLDVSKCLTGQDNLMSQLDGTGKPAKFQMEFLDYYLTEEELQSIKDKKFECDLLYSELADTDVKNFIETNKKVISFGLLFHIYFDVIEGIIDMQKEGYIHGDLHLGNVLLLIDKSTGSKLGDWKIVTLLHDFGTVYSEKITENRFHDINTFTTHFIISIANNVAVKGDPVNLYKKFATDVRTLIRAKVVTEGYGMEDLRADLFIMVGVLKKSLQKLQNGEIEFV